MFTLRKKIKISKWCGDGFTIIELLIVLSIIFVLTSISLIYLFGIPTPFYSIYNFFTPKNYIDVAINTESEKEQNDLVFLNSVKLKDNYRKNKIKQNDMLETKSNSAVKLVLSGNELYINTNTEVKISDIKSNFFSNKSGKRKASGKVFLKKGELFFKTVKNYFMFDSHYVTAAPYGTEFYAYKNNNTIEIIVFKGCVEIASKKSSWKILADELKYKWTIESNKEPDHSIIDPKEIIEISNWVSELDSVSSQISYMEKNEKSGIISNIKSKKVRFEIDKMQYCQSLYKATTGKYSENLKSIGITNVTTGTDVRIFFADTNNYEARISGIKSDYYWLVNKYGAEGPFEKIEQKE